MEDMSINSESMYTIKPEKAYRLNQNREENHDLPSFEKFISIDNAESITIERIEQMKSKFEQSKQSSNLLKQQEKKNVKWSKEEDELLTSLVQENMGKSWKKISMMIEGRTAIQCLHRWTKILKPGLIKGPWTEEEDKMLINYVNFHGTNNFADCSRIIKGRNNKQCRERWFNVLNPRVLKGEWSLDEDYLIFRLFTKFGGKWIKFTPLFNGLRAENSIKNRFYSTIRRFNTMLRKQNKNYSDENAKIQAIFEDFRKQVIEKYSLENETDFQEYEIKQLGFNGTLTTKDKDDRSVAEFKSLPNICLPTSLIPILKIEKSSVQADISLPKKPIAVPADIHLNSNTKRGKNRFINRKLTADFSESSLNLLGVKDGKNQASKTPFLKVKQYPRRISDSINTFNVIKSINGQSVNSTPKASKTNEITKTLKIANASSIDQLQYGITKICDQPTFYFKDEQSIHLEKKIQGLTDKIYHDPFVLDKYTHFLGQSNETNEPNYGAQNENFKVFLKQFEDLELLLMNTITQISDNKLADQEEYSKESRKVSLMSSNQDLINYEAESLEQTITNGPMNVPINSYFEPSISFGNYKQEDYNYGYSIS